MTNDEKKKICGIIDRGTWQHSCHLLKTEYGYTDWMNKKNLQECYEIAVTAANEGMNLMYLAGEVKTILIAEICEIEIQEKIDAGPEQTTKGEE